MSEEKNTVGKRTGITLEEALQYRVDPSKPDPYAIFLVNSWHNLPEEKWNEKEDLYSILADQWFSTKDEILNYAYEYNYKPSEFKLLFPSGKVRPTMDELADIDDDWRIMKHG